MRRLLTALVLLGALTVASGCAKSSRGDARETFTQQLVDEGGLPREVAECVTERFFAGRSDEELKAFFEREELTDDEAAEFQALGDECADGFGEPES